MSLVVSRDALFKAVRPGGTSAWVEKALMQWVTEFADRDSSYEHDRLHVGSDLSPDACPRKTWFRLHGATKDPLTIGDALRLHGGEFWESVFAKAVARDYPRAITQVVVQPVRPSAWAWAPGHADVLIPDLLHLKEVKAPRAGLFRRALGNPRLLAKTSYRWQLSHYFHELRRRGRARTAHFLFIDREGSNSPVEVPLEDDMVVPLDAIVEREHELSKLVTQPEPPSRPSSVLEVRAWKGPRVKKGEAPKRRVLATEKRYWGCSYCPYVGACQPGAEKRVVPVEEAQHDSAVNACVQSTLKQAEQAWGRGEKRTPFVARFGGADEEEEEEEEEDEDEVEVETTTAEED